MEVYILDSLYRRVAVVDRFESLIWTERFSAWGDFELHIQSTNENRNLFKADTNIVLNESYRVMTVETIEDTYDLEGKTILKVKGRSLEAILEDRLAVNTLTSITTDTKWELTDVPTAIIRTMFHNVCVLGNVNSGDIIPGLVEGNVIFPTDTIGEPSDVVTYSIDPRSLYQAIKDLADIYSIGFRLVRDPSTNTLYWDVYMGSDRTSAQTSLPAVIFSPDLQNLHNTTLLTSGALYKNVAYVISAVGHEIVYLDDVDPTTNGFERNVLIVLASDINDPTPSIASAQMIQKGKDELAKNRRFQGFDGEVAPSSGYVYGVHYNLGDLVEIRSGDGTASNMQVTEQIFVSDKEGDRRYPTLSVNTFITPGSWLAWDFNQHWADLDLDSTAWADLP